MWIFTILGFIILFKILTRGEPLVIDVTTDTIKIDTAISISSREFNHDPALVQAVIQVESAFNPTAVSSAGAIGLMQITEICLKHFNEVTKLNYSLWDLHNIAINIHIGCWYLRWLKTQLDGDLEQVLRSYNCGMGNRAGKACGEYYDKVMKEYDRLRGVK